MINDHGTKRFFHVYIVTNEAVCRCGVDATLQRAWSEKHLTHHLPPPPLGFPSITVKSLKQPLKETEGLLSEWQVKNRETLLD